MGYRLDKYRIIESEDGILWWEAHFPFAMQRRGKCFILGDILIIGHPRYEESGFLILEFHDQLKKLPAWDKTSYYCYASDLLDVATSENLSEDLIQRMSSSMDVNNMGLKHDRDLKAGIFRLGQYQIDLNTDGEANWQTHEGINRIAGGPCIVESCILFIGSQGYERGEQNKEMFISELNQLPLWSNTVAWCKSMVLQPCRPQQQTKQPIAVTLTCDRSLNVQPSAICRHKQAEGVKKLLRSGINWLKISWQRIETGKFSLKYLIPLAAAFMLLGLVLLFYSTVEKIHWSHLDKEHHDKHDDEKD